MQKIGENIATRYGLVGYISTKMPRRPRNGHQMVRKLKARLRWVVQTTGNGSQQEFVEKMAEAGSNTDLYAFGLFRPQPFVTTVTTV